MCNDKTWILTYRLCTLNTKMFIIWNYADVLSIVLCQTTKTELTNNSFWLRRNRSHWIWKTKIYLSTKKKKIFQSFSYIHFVLSLGGTILDRIERAGKAYQNMTASLGYFHQFLRQSHRTHLFQTGKWWKKIHKHKLINCIWNDKNRFLGHPFPCPQRMWYH